MALRPVVQDAIFPTVAMACGPGEIAYLAQLREVFEGLQVAAACPVPRLGVTWLPPAAVALIEAAGVEPWEVVAGADAVLRRLAEQSVPAGPRTDLERARADALSGLERFAASAREVDASLPQLVESARAKVDYQFQRLLEGLTGKVRHRLEREHPEWLRLRYYLMPGDRLQERRLASLEVVAHRGRAVVPALCDLAAEHVRALDARRQRTSRRGAVTMLDALFFGAHPDDVELCCGRPRGAARRARARGRDRGPDARREGHARRRGGARRRGRRRGA